MACDVGIVGLGTMGRNLALNLADQGFGAAVTDPWPEARQGFRDSGGGSGHCIVLAESLDSLLDSQLEALEPPGAAEAPIAVPSTELPETLVLTIVSALGHLNQTAAQEGMTP